MKTHKKKKHRAAPAMATESPSQIIITPHHRILMLVLIIGIILVSCGVYWNSLGGSFHYDDDQVIVFNDAIKDIHNVPLLFKNMWARPFLMLTFALNYHFGELNPWGYHLVNILLHSATCIALFFMVFTMLKLIARSGAEEACRLLWCAGGVALLYATHPIQTESVAYVASRSSVLATLFYCVSFLFFMRYLTFHYSTDKDQQRSLTKVTMYFFGILFYGVGITTKEIVVTLPVMLVFYDYIFLRPTHKRSIMTILKQSYVPFIVLLLSGFLLRLHYYGTAGNPGFQREKWVNLLTQVRVLASYLKILMFPVGFNFDKYYSHSYFIDARVFGSGLLLAGIFASAIWLLRFKHMRVISFGIFWFFITIAPTSSIIPLQDVYTEHRLYLPSIGFFMVIGYSLWLMLNRWKKVGPRIFMGCMALIISVYAVGTIRRNRVYRDPITLWSETITASPGKARPYNNLGRAYREAGQTDIALKQYLMAVRLWPEYTDALYNAANCYRDKKQYDKAIEYYHKTLSVDPNYIQVYNNIGITYQYAGDLHAAERAFKTAIKIKPDYLQSYNNLAALYFKRKDYAKSLDLFNKMLTIDPAYQPAYVNLATCYIHLGDLPQARMLIAKALALNPRNPDALKALSFIEKHEKPALPKN